jgi:hypothetical protein
MAYKCGTWWIRNPNQDTVAKAVDRHLAGKPPTSIVAVNISPALIPSTKLRDAYEPMYAAFVTIRYEG